MPVLSRSFRIMGCVLCLGVGAVTPTLMMTSSAMALSAAPSSFADLAEQVSEAVVNISAATAPTKSQINPLNPQLPPGSSLDELFDELFKRRSQQGEGVPQPRGKSLGSGFVVDPNGIVITNNHVIDGATEITVVFTNGQKLKAEIVGRDAKTDVAVLRVKPEKPLKAVKFGDSDKMRVGDWVIAVGNPFGLGGTVTAGIISARNRNIDSGPYDDYIQTDAAINKGNSGGPLFNMAGEVIGVNTAILSPSGGSVGIGFANPSSLVMSVVDQLQKTGEVKRGWLGVHIQAVDDTMAESLNLGKARGALVAGIDDNGPSKPAGIKSGDVIIKFDGQEISNAHDLPKLVARTPIGKEVNVAVIRDGKEKSFAIALGAFPKDAKPEEADKENKLSAPSMPEKSLNVLDMDVSSIDSIARKRYNIDDKVTGVLIQRVGPNSNAKEKGVREGEIISQIAQELVKTPRELEEKVKNLKAAGKKSALFLLMNAKGDTHFVALPLE